MNWMPFFKSMEKTSGLVGSAIVGALNVSSLKSDIGENIKKMKLSPIESNQPPLPSIDQAQFGGSKRLPSTSTVLPNSTRYS